MNYVQLQQAIIDDSHRSDFAGAVVQRFIAQGETLISTLLEGYGLEYTLTDADRADVTTAVYNLPNKLIRVRHIHFGTQPPLTQVDETGVSCLRSSANVQAYAVRPLTVVIAGTPAEDAELLLQYFGMPLTLSDVNNENTLLTDYPQLYIEAAQVYLFKRIQNFDAAEIAKFSVEALCNNINRKVKKSLSGAQAANPYNVHFRSSY
jgi:hypothetical protein